MSGKFLNLCCTLLLLFSASLSAQEYDDWNDDNDSWVDLDIYFWYSDSRPFIELNYGIGEPKHRTFNGDFSRIGLGEIKLGYSSIDTYFDEEILELEENYFFVTHMTKDFNWNDDSLETGTTLWRFGFGNRYGYGYKASDVSVFPFISHDFTWSQITFENFAPLSTNDRQIALRYDDAFRFGTNASAGFKFLFGQSLAFTATYETSVIFPRHMFWYHAGSAFIEHTGLGLIDYFVDEIMDTSPEAGPIINFLLKAAYSYGFYSLKRDKMNWPITTETPITYETARLGVSFTF